MTYETDTSIEQADPTFDIAFFCASACLNRPSRKPSWYTNQRSTEDRKAPVQCLHNSEAIETARYTAASLLCRLNDHPLWQRKVRADFEIDIQEPEFLTLQMLMIYAKNASQYLQISFTDIQIKKQIFSFRSWRSSCSFFVMSKRFVDSFDRLVIQRDVSGKCFEAVGRTVQSKSALSGRTITLAEIEAYAAAANLECSWRLHRIGASFRPT